MHFNDDLPQFKNILITNMQNNIGYIYDQVKQQFITVNKDDLLEKIIDMRMIDIEDFYKVCKNKLSETTKKKLDLLIEDIYKDKYSRNHHRRRSDSRERKRNDDRNYKSSKRSMFDDFSERKSERRHHKRHHKSSVDEFEEINR